MINIKEVIPSEFYSANVNDRKDYETRAEAICAISLPYIIRADGADKGTAMLTSASQSFNGRMINNLKAKMGMALLPPATSSFRLTPDPLQLRALLQGNEKALESLSSELSLNTDAINTEMEDQQIRASLFDMLTQLVTVGSVVVEKKEREGMAIFPLKTFVVKLNSRGEPLAICVQEMLEVLPEGVVVKDEQDEYELYTLLALDKDTNKWVMKQDIDGEVVGKEVSYENYDKLPFRYFGWTWMQGEKYHRPFAEDHYADMSQIDKLGKLNTDGAIISAKSMLFVNQRGGRTRKQDVANSANGGILDGSAEDVTSFQFSKFHDFNVSNNRESVIKKELQAGFLDTGSIQRDAERVTAEEIRVMAQQLEASTLAGVYSKMALKWSKWIVSMVMEELGIKFNSIDVNVLTGLDALGRSQEAQKMDAYVGRLSQLQLTHWIKSNELLRRYASFDGINTVNLLKTSDEVKKEQEAAQAAERKATMMNAGAETLGQEGAKAAVNPQQQGGGQSV